MIKYILNKIKRYLKYKEIQNYRIEKREWNIEWKKTLSTITKLDQMINNPESSIQTITDTLDKEQQLLRYHRYLKDIKPIKPVFKKK